MNKTQCGIAYLEELVERLMARGERKLPTLMDLSRQAGVSNVPMQAAIREMVTRGVLQTRRGSGIYLAGTAGPASPSRRLPKWEKVARAIEDDIRDGVYRRGDVLPAAKELCRRYRVCPATLRKTLSSLVSTSIVEPDRRHYLVPGVRGTGDRSTIVAVAFGTTTHLVSSTSPRHSEALQSVEYACTAAGLRLKMEYYYFADDEQVSARGRALSFAPAELERVLGFIVFTRGLRPETIGRAMAGLATTGLPVAVHDVQGYFSEEPSRLRMRHSRVFPLAASSVAGEHMGRFVAGLGHRDVAYVGFSNTKWSEARREGLEAALRASLGGGTVHEYSLDEQVIADGTTPVAGEELIDTIGEQVLPDSLPGTPAAVANLRSNFFSSVRRTLAAWGHASALMASVAPVLRSVLRDRTITAIVCANDDLALAVAEVLKTMHVRVPHDISLAGFDNALPVFLYGITSYDFNNRGVAQAMVNYIIAPPRGPSRPHRSRLVEVGGFVHVRDSVRQVRVG